MLSLILVTLLSLVGVSADGVSVTSEKVSAVQSENASGELQLWTDNEELDSPDIIAADASLLVAQSVGKNHWLLLQVVIAAHAKSNHPIRAPPAAC